MAPEPLNTLTPQTWTWNCIRPSEGWLDQCPPHRPVVWQAWLTDDQAILSRLTLLLSADEKARLQRFRFREDQQRFLIGRGLLRVFVGAQLKLPPERVELNYGPFGKPFARSQISASSLQFNVSHSGKLVLLVFHRVHEVGVDVEQMRPGQDWEAVAKRVFPAEEYRRWTLLNPQERFTAFFQIWTRHEAKLKTLGLGFSDESESSQSARLVCFDLELPDGYQGAVGCLR